MEKQAQVHCVIIGFSDYKNSKEKKIFDLNEFKKAENINPYLTNASNVIVSNRAKPICDVPQMSIGSMPVDGGHLLLNEDEKNKIIKESPFAQKWIRPFIGGNEFINNKKRWCLWLVNANPSELQKCKLVMERIDNVRKLRLESKSESTRKASNIPTLFRDNRQPLSDYLVIPKTTSENRKYIPIDFASRNVIVGDSARIISNATLYLFGVLTSSIHMAWTKAVSGRLGMGYRYSIFIVYNNFIWPNPTPAQKEKIESAAQLVLDARKLYPESTLANLYNPAAMPPELANAHEKLDVAVKESYGNKGFETEEEIVASLMELYKEAIDREKEAKLA